MLGSPQQVALQRRGRAVKAAALTGALLGGAYLMAAVIASSGHASLGLVSLVPLFLVIRLWRPVRALLAGGLWGASLWVFSTTEAGPAISSGLESLVLLSAIPAVYACLGAWLTRRIGFNPFVLGFGWMGVELALAPAGLRTGLLGATEGSGTVLHWVSGALGYVLVAFIIALFSASVVSVLSAARWPVWQRTCRSPSRNRGALLAPQTFFSFPLFAIHPPRPRAPPLPG